MRARACLPPRLRGRLADLLARFRSLAAAPPAPLTPTQAHAAQPVAYSPPIG